MSGLFRMSLRKKMIFIMAGVVLFSTTATTIVSSVLVKRQFDDQLSDRTGKALMLVKKLVRDSQDRVRSLAVNLAGLPLLQSDLATGNDAGLQDLLQSTKKVFNVAQISVYDREGTVFSVADPTQSKKTAVRFGIQGAVEQFGFSATQEGLFLYSTYPIKNETGYLRGLVEVKIKINQAYLDEIKTLSGYDITIFYGIGEYATTLSPEILQRLKSLSPRAAALKGKASDYAEGYYQHRDYVISTTPMAINGEREAGALMLSNSTIAFQKTMSVIQWNILGISIASVLLAVTLTIGLAKRISRPIQLLVEGTRQIARGKLSDWISVKASDEIGELAYAFDAMVHNLKTTTVSRNELVKEVSVRELSERALRESEERMRNIINSALDAVVVMNQEGFITSWNPQAEKIFGWTVLEAKKKKMIELIFPQGLWETYNNSLKEYLETGENEWFNKRIETMACDSQLRNFPIEAAIIPTRFSEGCSFSVFIRDITESKQAQEKLQSLTAELTRSNKELEGFAFVASHDLQEPLRKIVSFGDLLQSEHGKELSDSANEYLQKMQNAAKRMSDFISDLLDYSRITTKAKPFEQLNLNQVIEGVLSDLEMRAKDAKATVEVRPLPEIKADRFQMHQLFQNLISNAMKFRKPGVPPHIIIDGKKDETGNIEITLQDNGIGFEEKHARRIFGLFMRLHSRSEYEGTGIGLAVCEKIVLRHGGQIEAHGELGKGALFIIKIPAIL